MNINSYGTNFDAPDVHVDKLCLLSDAQAEKYNIKRSAASVARRTSADSGTLHLASASYV
jgi:hypothetical protein